MEHKNFLRDRLHLVTTVIVLYNKELSEDKELSDIKVLEVPNHGLSKVIIRCLAFISGLLVLLCVVGLCLFTKIEIASVAVKLRFDQKNLEMKVDMSMHSPFTHFTDVTVSGCVIY